MGTTISISTSITQADIDSYTFPIIINGGTLKNPVIISFGEDLTIGSSIGTSGDFIIGSEYITINGQSHTVTINNTVNYPGLIQNGTNSLTAYTNVTLENIGVFSSETTTLLKYTGWLCQPYYGRGISTGLLLITNCNSNGTITKDGNGGICGVGYGLNASGGIFLITNCYSTGNMTAQNGGGICGGGCGYEATGGKIEIKNCYSIGIISGIVIFGLLTNFRFSSTIWWQPLLDVILIKILLFCVPIDLTI